MARKSKSAGGRGSRKTRSMVTGGGEFSEAGSEGRTSKTVGNQPLSGEFSGSGSPSGESAGKSGRFMIDCSEAGGSCSLKISGSYDEVLAAGVEHGRSAHGMTGDDAELRDEVKAYVKEEPAGIPVTPGRVQGERGRAPGLPS